MKKAFLVLLQTLITFCIAAQDKPAEDFHTAVSLANASVSLCVANESDGKIIIDYNSNVSLTPASVMKLITSAAALELLGPEHTFTTSLGYTGSISKLFGRLKGDIIIKGGGDPALGSRYFSDYYGDFTKNWAGEIKKLGIKRIRGRVIVDDSYFDYQPVPGKWMWEDTGNYYGAGAFGLSFFDNTYDIHLRTTTENTIPIITEINPRVCNETIKNMLKVRGTDDKGCVYSIPYGPVGWMTGTIPANQLDYILKASISDPPSYYASYFKETLRSNGIKVKGEAVTVRRTGQQVADPVTNIASVQSPPLSKIIEVLNHESVNLFAEHLLKELGKKIMNEGSTAAGLQVITKFLNDAAIDTNGMFIEDGSGLSPADAINTKEIVKLLVYMSHRGKHFNEFIQSLPDAGIEGTLKNSFKDPVFSGRLKAKSGSMTRVRSYAGYFTTVSGKKMVFSIIINNFSGPSGNIMPEIEDNIKQLISDN